MRPTVDILFLAHGRPEFTSIALLNLLRHTDWSLVSRFYIYTDGDRFILDQWPEWSYNAPDSLGSITANENHYGGPVAILSHCLSLPGATYVCKIDNDTMVPPQWLETCLDVLSVYSLDLLGIEAWAPDALVFPIRCPQVQTGGNGIRMVRHIGGIGFFRCEAFATAEPIRPDGRLGLTEWQDEHVEIKKAFLDPPLPVFLLDHLPMQPWQEINAKYDAEGQQRREWRAYPEDCKRLWDWWEGTDL